MGKSENGIPEVERTNPDGMSDESRWNGESRWNDKSQWDDESTVVKGGVPHTKEENLEKEDEPSHKKIVDEDLPK